MWLKNCQTHTIFILKTLASRESFLREHMCYICVLMYVLSHTGHHKIYQSTIRVSRLFPSFSFLGQLSVREHKILPNTHFLLFPLLIFIYFYTHTSDFSYLCIHHICLNFAKTSILLHYFISSFSQMFISTFLFAAQLMNNQCIFVYCRKV